MNRPGLLFLALILSFQLEKAAAATVVAVATNNPVSALSKNQIADIFLGKASRFPNGELAVPIDQIDGAAVRNDFYEKFAGKSPAQLKAHWSKMNFTGRGRPPPTVADSNEVKQQLLNKPNGIGYIDDRDLDSSIKVLSIQ